MQCGYQSTACASTTSYEKKLLFFFSKADRLCVAIYELAFSALRVEHSSNPKAELFDPTATGGKECS